MMRKSNAKVDQTTKKYNLPRINRKHKLVLIILSIFIFLVSGIYLNFEWNRYNRTALTEAIQLAESLEALLHFDHIKELSGDLEDLNKPEYVFEKEGLVRLAETTNSIRFAYLMAERNGKLIFLMDSEYPDSDDYSPPGQVYEEVDDLVLEPFRTGKTIITPLRSDRWGNWINALVPIKDANNNIIAIFGIDFSASEWNAALWKQMIPDFLIVLIFILLYFSFLFIWTQQSKLGILNRKLIIDEAFYRTLFEQAPIGIAIMEDKHHSIKTELGDMTINPAYAKILGRSKEELQNLTWTEITHTDDLSNDLYMFEQFKKGEIKAYTIEKRYIKPDGSFIWVNTNISPFLGDDGNSKMHLTLIEDISEKKQTEFILKEKERRENVILSHLPGMAYRCSYDRNWTIQYTSDGCFELTGYSPSSLINNRNLTFNDIISKEYRELLWNEWARVITAKLPFKYEYEIITAAGQKKWVIELGQAIYNEQGKAEALEGIILDISYRKQIENNLKYVNEHDRLTKLYNRDFLEKFLIKTFSKHNKSKKALISINLSTVQILTANYGFHYTQNLVKKAAEALSVLCSNKAMLFKTYENRFVFYISDYKDKSELLDFSENIAGVLESIFVEERIGAGIGILEINKIENYNIDQLLKKLLIASEKAINFFDKDFKACFYDEELEAMVNREGYIRQALSLIAAGDTRNQLFLQYQPIMDAKTDNICGFEALARLRTENLGLISPLEFIPIAEKTKLIIPLGEKIIYDALCFLKKLNERIDKDLSVSINVCVIQLLKPGFTNELFNVIEKLDVNPQNVGIELTESIFSSDYQHINSIIGELKKAGIQLAIDDFGTGYSSLAREKELNVNCLKVDKYFVDKLLETDINKAILGDIISMAHKLGHCAVAEGVEYIEQLKYLKDHGCDKIQGYIISKPIDEEKAFEFIRNKKIIFDCHSNDSQTKGRQKYEKNN